MDLRFKFYPVGRSDGLDGVGGEGPHVTDGVQQVVPGGQSVRQGRATGLKTLQQTSGQTSAS